MKTNAYFSKEEKLLPKEKSEAQTKFKVSRRIKIINIREKNQGRKTIVHKWNYIETLDLWVDQ